MRLINYSTIVRFALYQHIITILIIAMRVTHKRTTVDYEFEFVNDIEPINLNFVIKYFLMGVGFLSHGGLGCGS